MKAETLFGTFEPEEPEAPAKPDSSLSAGQRLTLRQAAMVKAGIHPLTRGTLHPLASRHRDSDAPKDDPFTCGSCVFRRSEQYHDRTYPKCWLPSPGADPAADSPRSIYGRVTNGAASDVRAWWPACPEYSPGGLGPDAARWIP